LPVRGVEAGGALSHTFQHAAPLRQVLILPPLPVLPLLICLSHSPFLAPIQAIDAWLKANRMTLKDVTQHEDLADIIVGYSVSHTIPHHNIP
jgi:hypothetical protein